LHPTVEGAKPVNSYSSTKSIKGIDEIEPEPEIQSKQKVEAK
jgi:hypothetical protein